MTETAVLGLEVRSEKVKQAATELDKFAAAAKKSEKSTIEWADRVELANKKVEKATSQVNAATKPLDVLTNKVKDATRELDLMGLVVEEFSAGLMRTVGPAALAGAAFTAASAAAVAAWRAIVPEVRTVDDVLKQHEENVRRLGPTYEELAKQTQKFVKDSKELANLRFSITFDEAQKTRLDEARKALENIVKAEGFLSSRFRGAKDAIDDFVSSIARGEPAARALRERLAQLVASGELTKQAAADILKASDAAAIAEEKLSVLPEKADEVTDAFSRFKDAIAAIDAHKAGGALGEVTKRTSELYAQARSGQIGVQDLNQAMNNLGASHLDLSQQIEQLRLLGIAAINARQQVEGTPSKQVLPDLGTIGPVYSGGRKFIDQNELQTIRANAAKSRFQIEQEKLSRKSQSSAERDAKAYQQLIKSAEDRIKQMHQEIGLTGQLGAKAEAARYEMELISRATDRGRSISEKQRKEIQGLAEEYGRLKQAMAATKLQQDLLFERSQLFRTPTDQLIADTMRGAGLEVDFDSPIAGIIRMNEKIAETGDLIRGVTMDLTNGLFRALEDGKITTEEWGEIAMSVLGRISEKLVQMATDQLTSSLLGWLFGGMGGGVGPFPGGGSLNSTGGLWANGGAFQGGNVIPFARGGIVSKPTLFPMANGAGLMGEAGPEAIMPLQRGADGRLGVSMHSGQAANQNYANQNVRVEVEVFVNDDGTLGAIARQAGGEAANVQVKQGLAAYDKVRQKRFQAGGQFG